MNIINELKKQKLKNLVNRKKSSMAFFLLIVLLLTACSTEITLTLDAGEGVFSDNKSTMMLKTDRSVAIKENEMSEPTRGEDFEFGGWVKNNGKIISSEIKLDASETLKAKWLAKKIETKTIITKIPFEIERKEDSTKT